MNRILKFLGRRALPVAVIASILPFAHCSDSSGPGNITVARFISAVAVLNTAITGNLHTGAAPGASSGPTATTAGASIVINGGSSQVQVNGSAGFTTIIVQVQGHPGYYEVTLPSSQTSIDLILTLAQNIPGASFDIQYAVGAGATIGAYANSHVTVTQVGAGDIQVSVAWDVNSDVDLHVVQPDSEEIYYGNINSSTGGVLDLDSNPACSIDGVRNENVTWPSTTPAHGAYTVRVDYYNSCTEVQTNYVVTVQVKGQAPQTFTGTLTGTGDSGGAGSGVLITTFTF